MKYCPYCNQMVSPVKRPSWFLFIFLSVITVVVGFLSMLYIIFCLKKEQCPICGGKRFKEEIKYKVEFLNFFYYNVGG